MGTRLFQEEARSTATELEICRQERSQENGHQLARGSRGCKGKGKASSLDIAPLTIIIIIIINERHSNIIVNRSTSRLQNDFDHLQS